MDDLARVPLLVLASHAQKLARMGMITGEAALALIVWPDPEDMIRHLGDQPREDDLRPDADDFRIAA